MAFVDEDQGVVLLGQLADLPQGRDVTVHGEGTIGGHQPQAVFLREGRVARCCFPMGFIHTKQQKKDAHGMGKS